jgi:heme exporter protein C
VARALPYAALVSVVAAMAMVFFYAPTEAVQGDVQRIFYIHVPSAWVAYLAFIVVALSSVLVLAQRRARGPGGVQQWERWDRLGSASAEVGVVFTTIVLTTGPIWAKRAWGVWWSWDVRLTSTLVLWLVYVGYLVFRWQMPHSERRARLSAVIGIGPTVLRPGGPDLPGSMLLTLLVSLVAFTILYAALLVGRMHLEERRTKIEAAQFARV